MLEILERITEGKGEPEDIDLLLELADTISATALCGLGKSASNPVVSTIENFRDEYEAHVREKRCPAGGCQKLRRYEIDAELCRGCSRCAQKCPTGAISSKLGEVFTIDAAKCVKCGTCKSECRFQAIKEV